MCTSQILRIFLKTKEILSLQYRKVHEFTHNVHNWPEIYVLASIKNTHGFLYKKTYIFGSFFLIRYLYIYPTGHRSCHSETMIRSGDCTWNFCFVTDLCNVTRKPLVTRNIKQRTDKEHSHWGIRSKSIPSEIYIYQ